MERSPAKETNIADLHCTITGAWLPEGVSMIKILDHKPSRRIGRYEQRKMVDIVPWWLLVSA